MSFGQPKKNPHEWRTVRKLDTETPKGRQWFILRWCAKCHAAVTMDLCHDPEENIEIIKRTQISGKYRNSDPRLDECKPLV